MDSQQLATQIQAHQSDVLVLLKKVGSSHPATLQGVLATADALGEPFMVELFNVLWHGSISNYVNSFVLYNYEGQTLATNATQNVQKSSLYDKFKNLFNKGTKLLNDASEGATVLNNNVINPDKSPAGIAAAAAAAKDENDGKTYLYAAIGIVAGLILLLVFLKFRKS